MDCEEHKDENENNLQETVVTHLERGVWSEQKLSFSFYLRITHHACMFNSEFFVSSPSLIQLKGGQIV